MKFDGAHLNHFQQAFFVFNVKIFVRFSLVFVIFSATRFGGQLANNGK